MAGPEETEKTGSQAEESDRIRELAAAIESLKRENERLGKEIEEKDRTISDLGKTVEEKDKIIASLLEQRKESVRRLNLNSRNSSKPPSSDGYRKPKPKSLREKSGRSRVRSPTTKAAA